MGALVRWTRASDEIAKSGNRPLTQNLAPTNYGTTDNLAMGVWTPFRRDAVVAEANNEGHDHGSFPLHAPWYIARTLDGPDARPIWGSLLQWYWNEREFPGGQKKFSSRPLRDTTLLLGVGASGIGPGMLPTKMNATQSALLKKIATRLERVGEAAMQLEMPGQNGVAVFYGFTQEALDPYHEERFWTAHAAWYDLMRAHVPTAVVTEQSISDEVLQKRFKAVFLPGIQYPLPEKTLAALAVFQKSGGQVWLDAGARISIPDAKVVRARYRPFWAQDSYYSVNSGYGVGGYDGNSEYRIMKDGSDARLPAIKEAFGAWAIGAATSDDADVFLQERKGGQATYIFASNDHYPDEPLWKTHLAFETPAPAKANFHLKGGAIYDAMAMKPIASGAHSIEFSDVEPSRIRAILPRAIDAVNARAAFLEGAVFVTISVLDAAGKPIPAVVPLEISVTDAAKKEWKLWRATDENGVCRVKIPVGALAPNGAWQVKARELLSGKNAPAASATVTSSAPAKLLEAREKTLVFDASAIAAWLRAHKNREVWIALDKDQGALREAGSTLAQLLIARGVQAKVINIADEPEVPLFPNIP